MGKKVKILVSSEIDNLSEEQKDLLYRLSRTNCRVLAYDGGELTEMIDLCVTEEEVAKSEEVKGRKEV